MLRARAIVGHALLSLGTPDLVLSQLERTDLNARAAAVLAACLVALVADGWEPSVRAQVPKLLSFLHAFTGATFLCRKLELITCKLESKATSLGPTLPGRGTFYIQVLILSLPSIDSE